MNTHFTQTTAPVNNTEYANRKQGGHKCEYIPEPDPSPYKDTGCYGVAVDDCWEADDGTFITDNGVYSNRVNFCPFCGTKAPTQI